ncbi:MAG: MoxR family ATPase [Cyclobacteriaceae bacterium]
MFIQSTSISEELYPEILFIETFDDGDKSYPRMRVINNQYIPDLDVDGKPKSIPRFFRSDESLLVSCDKKIRMNLGPNVICAVNPNSVKLLGADGSRKPSYYIHKEVFVEVVKGNEKLEKAYAHFRKTGIAKVPNGLDSLSKEISRKSVNGTNKLQSLIAKYPCPTLLQDGLYVNENTWKEILLNISLSENILLFGPTGTAKTLLSKYIGKVMDREFIKLDFGGIKNGVSHLIGEHRIGENGTSVFDLAVFPLAIQRPSTILLDELNRAGDDVMNILLPVLDSDRTLRMDMAPSNLPREIRVHDQVTFIATANIGSRYTGTNQIDGAIEDRFKFIELDYMPQDVECAYLVATTGIAEKGAKAIVMFANAIRKAFQDSILSKPISARGTHRIATYVEAGFSLKEAFSLAIYPHYDSDERERLNAILSAF